MSLFSARRSGFVLVTMLCCLVLLAGFLGLAIDTGYLEWVKTRLQTAADAAAIGGVQEIKMNGAANVVTAAQGDAARNGFTDGQNGVTVTVNNPPSGGYSTKDPTGVEVIVAQKVATFFMGAVGASSVTLQARAVAHQASGTVCVVALDSAAAGAFTASNGANVQSGCGIMVDSASSTAFTVSGGTTVKASSIWVTGGSTVTGGSSVTPTASTAIPAMSDPLANISPPAVGACTYFNTVVGGGLTKTLPPGVYCNGISLGNGAHITFAPAGTYILKGGGLSIAGGVTVTGTGVTFYNTSGGGYSYQPFNFSNGATVTLTAPTTGPLAGILLFQDRSIVSSAVNSFLGGTTNTLNGALYFPTTPMSYSNGTTTSSTYTILVAKTLNFQGGCKVNNDYSSLPGGSPVKGNATLSE